MKLSKYKFDGSKKFNISKFPTLDNNDVDATELAITGSENLNKINKLQQALYAERKAGVIFIFQAMDAAGKDGTIRAVFGCLSPHGVNEFCFKTPTTEEKSHDFLWRFWKALPQRGFISIFNRSYYEDVLVGRVHRLYEQDKLPDFANTENIIEERYRYINQFEDYLTSTGTKVVKIFLDVSKKEQAKRFISRMEKPKKYWKISSNDLAEREYWDEYMQAFEDMVNKTASKKSPWYVIPADDKLYMRYVVSEIVRQTLEEINPKFPKSDYSEEYISERLEFLKETLNK